MEGDVYKEAEQVVDSNAILNKIKIFYEKQILIRPVTVTEVNIVYTGYFTDGNEGEIQPTVAPFWRVKVYNNDSNGSQFFSMMPLPEKQLLRELLQWNRGNKKRTWGIEGIFS